MSEPTVKEIVQATLEEFRAQPMDPRGDATLLQCIKDREDVLHKELGDLEAARTKLPEALLKMKRSEAWPLLRFL